MPYRIRHDRTPDTHEKLLDLLIKKGTLHADSTHLQYDRSLQKRILFLHHIKAESPLVTLLNTFADLGYIIGVTPTQPTTPKHPSYFVYPDKHVLRKINVPKEGIHYSPILEQRPTTPQETRNVNNPLTYSPNGFPLNTIEDITSKSSQFAIERAEVVLYHEDMALASYSYTCQQPHLGALHFTITATRHNTLLEKFQTQMGELDQYFESLDIRWQNN